MPPALRPMFAIGESVMLGATNQLQAGGFGVNASESRQGAATADVVGQLRAAGRIGETVVDPGGHQRTGVRRRPTT